MKFGLPVIIIFLAAPYVAIAQPTVEERLDRIEQHLDRLEVKIDRLLAVQEAKLQSAGGEIIREQDCDDLLLDKEFFVICYNAETKIANWVGYFLSEENLRGTISRTDDFRPDPKLGPEVRSQLADYRGSGFDRGHMAPAAAFKRSRQAMSTTFLLSNMAPQTPQLNRAIWRLLEDDVREVARTQGDVWVFTGNLFIDENGTRLEPSSRIGSNNVAVPTHCFKAILVRTEESGWMAYGFIMPNIRERIPGPVDAYQVPVDVIESASEIDFFAFLPDALEEQLERTRQPWPAGE